MEIDPEQAFRCAMSAFATGVTIVSAARADGRISGITVNSLTSVSLRPRLLLWCLGDQSARYDVFSTAPLWGVTVLGAGDGAVAQRFERAETETIAPSEAVLFGGAPVLNAGIAHIACRTYERRVTGDHLILVGEVLDVRVVKGAALAFFRGAYCQLDEPNSDTGEA
jgi:flavin reductase (DIM6/NTAB) family NADH-FMN oxidoreductase RutF